MMTIHAAEHTRERGTRARIATHRRRRGELPGVWVPQEYPVSTYPVDASTLLMPVPFEYPLYAAACQHEQHSDGAHNTAHECAKKAARTRSNFAAALEYRF